MRTLKSAEQRNCKIRTEYYTGNDLRVLAEKEPFAVFLLHEWDWRVDLTLCKSISVIYSGDYGCYANVVETRNGNIIYVEL